MRTEEEFKVFYESTLKTALQNLEKQRLNAKKLEGAKLKVGCGLFILLPMILLFPILAIPLGIYYLYNIYIWYEFKDATRDLAGTFKEDIIRPIVAFISPALSYHPTEHIRSAEFRTSQFSPEGFDSYHGDDLVTGNIDGVDIKFSELNVSKKQNDDDSKTVFSGLFFVADFHKEFTGSVILISTYTIPFVNSYSNPSGRSKVILEDEVFNEHYTCYAHDDITARYILSPTLMERLVSFKFNYPQNPIRITFTDGKVYIGIAHYLPLFEPAVSKPLDNYPKIRGYFEELNLAVGIVHDLDLNTRIWSKQ
jgi:hypothetical protein